MNIKLQEKLLWMTLLAGVVISGKSVAKSDDDYFDYYAKQQPELLAKIESFHERHGQKKIEQERFQHAWGDFSYILHYFPNHPRALNAIAELAIKLHRPKQAIKYYERALGLFPNQAITHQLYGEALIKLGRNHQAIKELKYALSLFPESGAIHFHLARAYRELNKHTLAEHHAKKAHDLGFDEQNVQQQFNLSAEDRLFVDG